MPESDLHVCRAANPKYTYNPFLRDDSRTHVEPVPPGQSEAIHSETMLNLIS